MTPPGEYVGLGQDGFSQPMLGLFEGGGAHLRAFPKVPTN
jgi:hypothetical protein